jgi:hypothetical protein
MAPTGDQVELPHPVPETGGGLPPRSPRQGLGKTKSGWASVPVLDQSEIEAATENYASTDEPRSKTLSRRLVENFLQHVSRENGM